MMPPPPPQSNKIPTWAWVLTVCGVLFAVGMSAAAFWVFNNVQELVKEDLPKSNPEFEMLYFARDGKLKVKHKSTGKEFLVDPPRTGGKIDLTEIATVKSKSLPEWVKLKDAVPTADEGSWDRAGDPGLLREAIEDVILDSEFEMLKTSPNHLTACSAKLLQCVVFSYNALEGEDNRSRYVAELYTTP